MCEGDVQKLTSLQRVICCFLQQDYKIARLKLGDFILKNQIFNEVVLVIQLCWNSVNFQLYCILLTDEDFHYYDYGERWKFLPGFGITTRQKNAAVQSDPGVTVPCVPSSGSPRVGLDPAPSSYTPKVMNQGSRILLSRCPGKVKSTPGISLYLLVGKVNICIYSFWNDP